MKRQRLILSRSRWAACLARLPHIAMLHHRLPRLRLWSAKIRVQLYPSHARMLAKSSSHTHRANAWPIGSSRDSGDRQRRVVCSSRRAPSLSRCTSIRLNVSSRSRSAFRGPSSRIACAVSGRPMCLRTKPLNHSRKTRAWSATLSSPPGAACSAKASSACAGIRLASASHATRPSPLSSQSTGASTGVAIEFRKSRPGESAMKFADGRIDTILH